ncbi:MAG: ABC transporter permease [bacterium]
MVHSYDRLSDIFFWPFLDLLMWGLTTRYIVGESGVDNKIVLALLGGLILWIFPWRSQYEISVSLLDDIWNRNFVNIFATPVLFIEWVVTLMLIGILKGIISFAFASALAYALYSTNIYSLGLSLLPWAGLLIIFGWVFGILISGIIMRYGTKIQTLAWTSIYMIAPFVGVFYPVSILPAWAQNVAHWVPASYVFDAMRKLINGTPVPMPNLIWPLILCLFYLIIAMYMLYVSYRAILKRGLISVE